MSFQLKIWDHCRYVKNRGRPYDEMVRHLETMAGAGISASVIYMPEVISLDDYCRAAEQAGIAVEARISPAWGVKDPVRRHPARKGPAGNGKTFRPPSSMRRAGGGFPI